MVHIEFGKAGDAYYGPGWFNNNYEQEWLSDPLVYEMIKDVDRSEYQGGELINSDVLGPISPRDLSGGVKTLICIYKEPGEIFDATSCGSNCAKWLIEIGNREDVTVNLDYIMHFENLEPFKIHIVNTDTVVTTYNEYVLKAIDVLHEELVDEG